jgi:hypothetical protein
MKTKRKKILSIVLFLILLIAFTVYIAAKAGDRHVNNRCTPVGDPREGTIDCAEFKYYDPALDPYSS